MRTTQPARGGRRHRAGGPPAWLAAVRARRPLLELVWLLPQANPWAAGAVAAHTLATGLLPVASMLAVSVLVAAVGGEPAPPPVRADSWTVLWALAGVLLTLHVAVPLLEAAGERLAHDLDLLRRGRLLRAVLAPPTIAHLEDPHLADELALAKSAGTEHVQTPRAVAALSTLGATRLMAAVSAGVLLTYRWWAPLVLMAAWALSNEAYRRQVTRLVASLEATAPGFRRARYLGDLALGGTAAKELRVFGLAGWLAERFAAHWQEGMRQVWAAPGRRRWTLLAAAVPATAGCTLVSAALIRSALRGELSLGSLALYLQALAATAGFGWDADNQYTVRLAAAPLPHTRTVCETTRGLRATLPGSRRPPAALRGGIRFEGVRFTYPGTDREVLRGLDLWLPAGRSLALVGDNGSGKTTVLKLLCRFYDPDAGRITVDGTDLRHLDPAGWQRHLAAIFQDYGRYPLSAEDTIALGDLHHRHDRPRLLAAARAAGVAGDIARLPAGWDTPLSPQFPGGVEPSGGQWQRLALARVLFAVGGGAGVLVLDEPTAALDIRAEAGFYDRFLRLTRGLTTILVSHRFSTVRHADQIVVLEGGRVAEAGSHTELLALGGRYASMFTVQAAAYRARADA